MLKSLVIILFSFNLFAASKMVFLVEGPRGKQVGISEDFSNYKFHTTSRSKWHLYPEISPDGSKLAYVQGNDQENLQLVIENLETNSKIILGKKGFVLQPKFSNEGRFVYVSQSKEGKNLLTRYDLGQTPAKVDILNNSHSFFPAPFADGTRIVYQRNTEEVREIVYLDLASNEEKILGLGMSPSLSKDERFVAFTSRVEGNWDIFLYDFLTKKLTKATNHPDRDFSPTFDLEGNLIFTSDRLETGVFSIFKITKENLLNSFNTEVALISKPGTSFYAPRVSGLSEISIEQAPDMTGKERSSFGSIEHQGKIYVVGGHQGREHTYPPESFTGRVSAYDLKSKSWTNLAPRKNPCHGFQLAAKGNFIYAFGGFAYEASNKPKWKSLSIVERYNIATNTWEEVGHMPRNRSSNVVAQVGDKVYLIGGWDSTPKFENDYDGTFHTEIDVFDLNTLTFSTLETRLPMKRRAFNSFVKDEKVYLVGGLGEGATHFELVDLFTEFDPNSGEFRQLQRLPFATFAPATGKLGDKAYMFGGMIKLGKWSYEYVPHIYEYSFKLNKWSHTGRYLKESKGFSQVVEFNNRLGILGGHSYFANTDSPVNTFEIFSVNE